MKLIINISDEAYKQIIDFGFLERTHGKMCYEAIKKAIPFEQIRDEIRQTVEEPFVNKPCISTGVCHEDKVKVLEQIRAEILALPTDTWNMVRRTKVLEIIDKYKAERSDKE